MNREFQSTRRDFLKDAVFGLPSIAAVDLLLRGGHLDAATTSSPRNRGPHFAPKAQHVIHIYLGGGLSQVDSFDFKPELEKYHGKDMPQSFGQADAFFGKVGRLHQSHYPFKRRGKSGLWVSDLFPNISEVADELTVINSMVAETANHIPGTFQANTGFRQMGFPAMGSWLSYGLGTENENLPGFVVLPDARGIPNAAGGAFNWASGFLPAEHQGVAFNTRGGPVVRDLRPAGGASSETQRERLDLIKQLDAIHMESQTQTDPLSARVQSYELAARMQSAIPDATDFSSEPAHVLKLYGLDRDDCRDTARNCLIARRLVERGVRMVQLWTGDGVSWDAHDDITGKGYKTHTGEARRVDHPIAGLIRDLKNRGLLDSTIIMITSEFGRTPFAQADKGKLGRGRDHHPQGFSNVLVGAGLKKGFAHGATDAIGYASVVDPVTVYDLHATVLHLLGIDHKRLTFYHDGIQRRLTNVHGNVVKAILA